MSMERNNILTSLFCLCIRLMIQHKLYLAYVKHLWLTERREEAIQRIENLCDVVDLVCHNEGVSDNSLRVSCWLELGDWKLSGAVSPTANIDDRLQLEVLTSYKRATLLANCGYRAWHAWALLNFRIAIQMGENAESINRGSPREKFQRNHIVAAVRGFVNAISLGTKRESASVQQDLLNLLTCLFQYGNLQDVASVINECIVSVALEAWLGVLPQLLARIHIKDPSIRAVLHPLLTRLGEKHPQGEQCGSLICIGFLCDHSPQFFFSTHVPSVGST
jgi:serine/threonine-protein kinase mTOR